MYYTVLLEMIQIEILMMIVKGEKYGKKENRAADRSAAFLRVHTQFQQIGRKFCGVMYDWGGAAGADAGRGLVHGEIRLRLLGTII